MAFVANPYAMPGIIVGLMAWAMGLFVYFARPERAQNRRLALLLATEGIIVFAGNGAMFATTDQASAVAWQALTTMAALAALPLYLRFIATLETPLVRPLRWRTVDAALLALAILLPMTWMFSREFYLAGMYRPWFAPWEQIPGPGFLAAIFGLALAYLFGLAAALHAFLRSARASAARRRAGWFVLAFGIRDGLFVVLVTTTSFVPALATSGGVGALMLATGTGIISLLYLPLLAYGILRTQMFDIELQIKWTIRRGTLLAVFIVTFVVIAEIAQNWMSNTFGYVAGGVVAGILLLFVTPLQRLADRVADTAMPGVDQSPAYLSYKRFEVYRAALEGALEEGGIDVQERAVLRRLREKLGLTDEDATAMEHELAARTPAAPVGP